MGITKDLPQLVSRAMHAARENRLWAKTALYVAGLFILALGVGFAIHSGLGVPPVNSLPFVVSMILGVSIGVCVTGWLLFFIITQCIVLRKISWIYLVQLLFAFVFGRFVDISVALLAGVVLSTYWGQLAFQGISIILVTLGIVMYLDAGLVTLPVDGAVVAITTKIPGGAFHRVKVVMDSTIVLAAIILSIIFLGGLYGVREGTVVSAVAVGKAMPFIRKIIAPVFRAAGLENQPERAETAQP